MGIIKHIPGFVLVAILASCNVSRVVKPLEKGEKQLGAAVGGPGIIFAGAPLPLPLTSVTYSHGLDTGFTVTGSVQTTSLLFGVAHIDATAGIRVFESKTQKSGITASPGFHLMYDFFEGNFRNYPQLEALSWWQYGEKPNLFYGGLGTWIELVREKAYGEIQENEFLPYLSLGHQFNRPRWSFTTEIKYLGFQHSTSDIVVDYISPFNQGAVGFYFGMSRRFGK